MCSCWRKNAPHTSFLRAAETGGTSQCSVKILFQIFNKVLVTWWIYYKAQSLPEGYEIYSVSRIFSWNAFWHIYIVLWKVSQNIFYILGVPHMSSREYMLINILSCFLLKGDSYKTLSSGAEYDNTLVCLTVWKVHQTSCHTVALSNLGNVEYILIKLNHSEKSKLSIERK